VDPPHVPSHNPTGVYQFDVDLAPTTPGARRILRIDGVGAYVEVHVNGVEVGWSKGVRLGAELDISDAARDGHNLVVLTVLRFADSTYLEGPPGWWAAGVLGGVSVLTRPPTRLDDYVLRTTRFDDGAARLTVGLRTATGAFEGPARVTWAVRRAARTNVLATGDVTAPTGTNDIDVAITGVDWWSPEEPALYVLELAVHRVDGTPTQHVAARFGFREVAVRDGVLHLNGRPFPLRGAPHADDVDPPHARTDVRDHLERLKRCHVNVVHADDYPAGPHLYELCDELGLLVVAGVASIAPAGAAGPGAPAGLTGPTGLAGLTDDAAWRRAFVDRIERHVTAYRNHPSVIAWSLGGRAGDGCNLAATYWACADLDPTRPAGASAALVAGVPASCPVTVSAAPDGLLVRNGSTFTSLDGIDLVVDDLVDGVVRASCTVAAGPVAPQASAVVVVPPPPTADGEVLPTVPAEVLRTVPAEVLRTAPAEVLRTVHVLRRAATPWSPAHATLGSYQWRVPAPTARPTAGAAAAPTAGPALPRGHVVVDRADQECVIRAASSTWAFDTVTGHLTRWGGAGRELVVRPPRVHHLGVLQESTRVVDVEHDDDAARVEVRTILAPPGRDFGLQVTYGWDLFDDGAARLTITGDPYGTCDAPVRSVGLDLGLADDLDGVECYGRVPGAHTSWIARRVTTIGATRERVRWVLHRDRHERGLLMVADRRSLTWSAGCTGPIETAGAAGPAVAAEPAGAGAGAGAGALTVNVEHRAPGSPHTRFGPFEFSLLMAPLDAGILDPAITARVLRATHVPSRNSRGSYPVDPGLSGITPDFARHAPTVPVTAMPAASKIT
jgi:beta-galactosidase/beta-glucuronidase